MSRSSTRNPPNLLRSEIRHFIFCLALSKDLSLDRGNKNFKMEFPPDEWNIFAAGDFELAEPRSAGDWGAEVMAQVRSNGRIMDHWRVALGGSKILEASFPLLTFFPAATNLPPWKLTYQQFPRDVKIRRNMVSSAWLDVVNLLASHEFLLSDADDQPVDVQQATQAIKALPARQSGAGAIRWCVSVTAAGKLELQLQALPSSANILTGKPIFNR